MKDNLFQNSIRAIGVNAFVSSIALIIIGIIFVISPVSSMAAISSAIGIILMIAGIMEIVVAIRSTGRPISLLTVGSLLLALAGLWIFMNPSIILTSINLVFGVLVIASALSSLGQAARMRGSGWDGSLAMVLSVAGIILGVLIILNPFSSIKTLARIIGIVMIYQGIVKLRVASMMRKA